MSNIDLLFYFSIGLAFFTNFKPLSLLAGWLGVGSYIMAFVISAMCFNSWLLSIFSAVFIMVRYSNVCALQDAYDILAASEGKKHVEP